MRMGLPGRERYDYGDQDYAAYIHQRGSGTDQLRTERVAQPGALKPGDILATGYAVVGEPRSGYNSIAWICISRGTHVLWVTVAPRIPLALLVGGFENIADERSYALPENLRQGDLLANGDEVLADPIWCLDETVQVCLTGGMSGHAIHVPDIIPIALLTESDNAPVEIREHAQRWKEKVKRSGE
jgi:hypothetical protein